MIRDITLKINGRDFSHRLSSYRVHPEISYAAQLTSINGVDHRGAKRYRPVIDFSLLPADSRTVRDDQQALSAPVLSVTFTNPGIWGEEVMEMILDTDLDSVFLLNSVDGNVYYNEGTLTLRARRPR